MKAVSKFVLMLGLLPALASAATPDEQAYLESCEKDTRVPVPVVVVSPSVGPEYHQGSVLLEFTVDPSGKPADFRVASATDEALAKIIVAAVARWRFQPAERDGRPVARRVALPVNVVDPVRIGDRYAAGR